MCAQANQQPTDAFVKVLRAIETQVPSESLHPISTVENEIEFYEKRCRLLGQSDNAADKEQAARS